ncbi:MAG: PQQ-binding-like beta-propeller repeat protein [Bryobacteraceae bacterium]
MCYPRQRFRNGYRATRWPARRYPGGHAGVVAVDPETGKIQWRYKLTQNSLSAGVLATAGGVVFAASCEGNFIALDARTGEPLWHFQAGNEIASSAMNCAVDGKQYVAISSAGVLFSSAGFRATRDALGSAAYTL